MFLISHLSSFHSQSNERGVVLGVNPKNIGKKLGLTYGRNFGMIFGMPDDKRGDEDLIRAYQGGDTSALEILLKRYETPLRNYIAIKCFIKDPHFIADILQEVLTIVFREISAGKFIPQRPGSFRSWVYQVARHQYLNAMNKLRSQAKAVSTYYPEEFPGDLDEVRSEPNTDPLVFNQQCEQINRALDKLDPLERKFYNLKSQGWSYQQIKSDPDFMASSLGALRVKFHEIIEKLRRLTKSTDSR